LAVSEAGVRRCRDNPTVGQLWDYRLPAWADLYSCEFHHDWPLLQGSYTHYFVYPSSEGAVWPSLRLDALRDGPEDHGYMHSAKEVVRRKPNPELQKLPEIDESMITDREACAQDAATHNARQAAIARCLEP